MIKQAMILAAGRGNRMMPLTRDIPKSMLKIGNMTLIEDKIIRLAEAGVEKIVINLNNEEPFGPFIYTLPHI